MRIVTCRQPGGPEALNLAEVPDVHPGRGEIAVSVAATAVNRADTLQRQGYYPPPPGASEVIGLECSGTVVEVGEGVTRWSVGDEVCALLAGGGYASLVLVPEGQAMPVPDGVDLVQAAALPEAAATVWSNVFMEAALAPGESLLVHGGAGGLGTFAIQLAAGLGHPVFATAGTDEKVATCVELGARAAVNYRTADFVEEVLTMTGGTGMDVVLDNMGASYLDRNVKVLATGGRLAIIGMQGGTRGELNIGRLLTKRARVIATSLRPRPVEEKSAICEAVVAHVWPLVADGRIHPVIDTTLPLEEVAEAHRRLEASTHTGKIVLTL